MKKMTKINRALYQRLGFGLILLVFVYWIYYLYNVYDDYRAERNMAPSTLSTEPPTNQTEAELPVKPPSFFAVPADSYAVTDIFSFTREKNDGPEQGGGEINKPSDYTILGVVKRDRLYLVVRLNAGNKLLFVPQGAALNDNYSVQKLENVSVVIMDKDGVKRTYKIFQWQNTKELPDEEKGN
ncbi:MAG: hypothetical protein MUF15_14825 [Acidobacteria bacterium]|jgi:hypothetical protein|nr:hypothetical protein [Acidobacteriota bacterium]